jgi:hypothetical protein
MIGLPSFPTVRRLFYPATTVVMAGLLAACSTNTLFQSNFNATPAGQPPAAVQTVGTAAAFGPPGSVTIVPSPVAGSADQWVRIGRADNNQPIAGMQGFLSSVLGAGKYNFLAAMYMPAGSGLATISFEPAYQPQSGMLSFLYLDLTQDNRVRIDDNDATKFGSFPRDTSFVLSVNLDTTVSPPTAHIGLTGGGASGEADYVLPSGGAASLAQQFGAIRLWMGYPWIGSFDATDVLVYQIVH